jgi:transposase
MGRKRHKPEEIVAKLRQVDVLTAQGTPVSDAIRSIGVTEVTYYRWRQDPDPIDLHPRRRGLGSNRKGARTNDAT